MPKRGDKYVHISVRVKRAFKKYKKTGVFKLTALKSELWPMHVSEVNKNATSGLVTMDVTFDYQSKSEMSKQLTQGWSHPIKFRPTFNVVPPDQSVNVLDKNTSTYTEHLTKEQFERQKALDHLDKQWLEMLKK
jgi:hypothetical protein